MRTAWIVSFSMALATGLAACSGGPVSEQPGANVEDRTATAKPDSASSGPVAKVDVTGKDIAGQDPAVKVGVLAQRSIFYDLDQYDIKDQYKPLVEAHAKYLRDHPGRKMLIQGNTDERGSREYNVSLGQRRSDNVKKMLLLLGAREDQVESVSLGEEKPRSEGHDEQAWAQNRRSDILYQGEY
ncbi:MAG TPA: peptidoglycan-associated lipoprotein Pal [Burkholderiales bacterium]|jgi:peptidoglycan-associated lipoprotein